MSPEHSSVADRKGAASHEKTLLDPQSFEECRQILIKVFSSCGQIQFQHVSCAISCVLRAVRALHASELQTAISIYSGAQYQADIVSSKSVDQFVVWMQHHQDLFTIDHYGYASFSHYRMAVFLRGYAIKGVDVSHRTIAMVCLERIRRFRGAEPTSGAEVYGGILLQYAQHYCRFHCEIASRSCISLEFDRPDENNDDRPSPGQELQDRFVALQIEDDWMYIKAE